MTERDTGAEDMMRITQDDIHPDDDENNNNDKVATMSKIIYQNSQSHPHGATSISNGLFSDNHQENEHFLYTLGTFWRKLNITLKK